MSGSQEWPFPKTQSGFVGEEKREAFKGFWLEDLGFPARSRLIGKGPRNGGHH